MDAFLSHLYAYLAGFGTCLALAIWWFHGNMKPKLDALKQAAADKIKAKL